MGNLLSLNLQTPEKKHAQPKDTSPRQGSNSSSTDSLLDGIDTHLTTLKDSIRLMKGQNSTQAREELIITMSKTEKDLHRVNQQLGSQKKRVGKSEFYRSLSQNDSDNEGLVRTLFDENDKLRNEYEDMKTKNNSLQREKQNLLTLLREEKKRTEKEEVKNTDLLLRLSKVAGQKLVENNPAIADLNDRNRPTKLGEIHSELYDNEWTDALDGLQANGYDEEFAIVTLYLTLVNVFDFCKLKADNMLKKTDDAINFLFEEYKLMQDTKFQEGAKFMTMPRGRVSCLKIPYETFVNLQKDIELQKRWKLKSISEASRYSETLMVEKPDAVSSHIKVLRKETAESMVPVVQKAYIKASWRHGEFVPALKPYIRKCIFLCWMMAVQSPPMCLHMVNADKDFIFDKNMYKEYTASGPVMKYIVWPALLLHENGPVVGKGVAQGCNHSDNFSQ